MMNPEERKDFLHRLRELGEWAAVGFYEAADLPWPRPYGRAYRRLYENMPITIPGDRLIHPHEPYPCGAPIHEHRPTPKLICSFHHNSGLCVSPDAAERRKKQFPQHVEFIDRLVTDLSRRLPCFGGYTHSNPDIRRVVDEGFLSMEAELAAELAAANQELDDADEQTRAELRNAENLLLTIKDYTAGVRAFYDRTLAALREAAAAAEGERRKELTLITDGFADCFMKPSTTFVQGLLAVNFAWMLDGVDSIGRVDQVLGPRFEKDLKSGELDLAFARRLLDEWWHDFERFSGWNMQIGGYTPEGRDGCNALTREIILTCGRSKIRRPNVAFRITKDTPADLLVETLKVLREGSGRPALYNDDLYLETLLKMDLGLTPEDARELGFGGCTETMIAGLSNVGSLEGYLNMAKALELAMHDGHDPITQTQAGPHTGRFEDFESFDPFVEAVKRQIQYMTDSFCARLNGELRKRFIAGDPKPYRTMFTRDCVKNRRSFEAGGARYNWSVVSYHGIANLIDGLAAIRTCVFEQERIGKKELVDALDADFEGREHLRRMLRAAPKFGNDDDTVDLLGRDVIRFAWENLYQHEPPRGGRYLPSCILFATYERAGEPVGATPDGRRARQPLVDSIGASAGCDVNGPTALLNSVTKLPLWMAVGTPVLNIRFQKAMLESAEGLQAAANLIRTFFAKGGMQIQLSVLSKKEMLAAQKEPEKYQDLIVRIGGYSEYFTRLTRGLQDSVIARTEHTVA